MEPHEDLAGGLSVSIHIQLCDLAEILVFFFMEIVWTNVLQLKLCSSCFGLHNMT